MTIFIIALSFLAASWHLPEYDFRSKTDLLVKQSASDRVLFSIQIKTNKAFKNGQLCYRGSRGPEVLAALYGYNSVTFLVTPKQWKLFVENEDFDAILTTPFADNPGPFHVCGPMGEDFVKALTICLLTPDQPTTETTSAEELVAVAAGGASATKSVIIPAEQTRDKRKSCAPKFPVGVDEFGHTVWQEITVWTPEQVAELLTTRGRRKTK
ncbi:hypothetical protein HDU76_004983 [Blyttiomyces sp. JEL0837]|nr:hypothetical protein HDU76_004983 [Blyttiomyces sp. JEL0837]